MCSHNAQVNFKLSNSSCQMIRELQAATGGSTRGVCLIKFTPHLDLVYVLYGGVATHSYVRWGWARVLWVCMQHVIFILNRDKILQCLLVPDAHYKSGFKVCLEAGEDTHLF